MERVEKRWPDEVAVVGVHSPKFPTEHDDQNVREAVLRYGIRHPVINDAEMALWQHYGIRAWPSLLFISPGGEVLGQHAGEVPPDVLEGLVAKLLDQHAADVQPRTLPIELERSKIPPTPLSFPGKVVAADDRLYISDSGHNRIAVSTLDGHIERTYEGDFHSPQGLALVGERLYVADTEHHQIKSIDVSSGEVSVIAGTGQQGVERQTSGPGPDVAISSPWDVEVVGRTLFIAMAGTHQLWVLDLETGRISDWAGSGRENIVDGPIKQAQLAQPSGITSDGTQLYFVDSETSSIRTASIESGGWVTTIVGQGLFEFGDRDGVGDQVRLQHPLGLCWSGGILYVADSYNNRVKRCFPSSRGVTTLAGSGDAGSADGQGELAEFNEPAGLAVWDGKLYVADTNNSLIRVCDLSDTTVRTLEMRE